jgi:hypothetical protein
MNLSKAVFSLFLLFLSSSIAFADSGEHESENNSDAHHEFHPNMLAVFVGVTDEDRNEDAATLGVEYARRFSESFSIVGVVERTFGDLDVWVYAIPFAYHTGQWKIYAWPVIEDDDGHDTEFLVRLGVEYGFEVGSWEIAPQLNVDLIDGDQLLVLGVAFGKGF